MSWDKLPMSDRARYIGIAVANGVTDLGSIRNTYDAYQHYNKFEDGGPEDKGFWDTVDDWVAAAEVPVAGVSLGASGATLVAPNPVTGAIAIGANATGALIDAYQGIRAGLRGDWDDVAKNATEFGLSLIGGKAVNAGVKTAQAAKAARAAASTVGTHRKAIKLGNKAKAYTFLGITSNAVGAASSSYDMAQEYKANHPKEVNDNTRVQRRQPVNIEVPNYLDTQVDEEWIKKQQRYTNSQKNYRPKKKSQ